MTRMEELKRMAALKGLKVEDVLGAWEAWEQVQADPLVSHLRKACEHLDAARELALAELKSRTPAE
jgi:hypothetical protein